MKRYQYDPDLALGTERRTVIDSPDGLVDGTARLVTNEGGLQMWDLIPDGEGA